MSSPLNLLPDQEGIMGPTDCPHFKEGYNETLPEFGRGGKRESAPCFDPGAIPRTSCAVWRPRPTTAFRGSTQRERYPKTEDPGKAGKAKAKKWPSGTQQHI